MPGSINKNDHEKKKNVRIINDKLQENIANVAKLFCYFLLLLFLLYAFKLRLARTNVAADVIISGTADVH